jgi:hypothetical protein
MGQRVNQYGMVKAVTAGAKGKPSLNRANKSCWLDPKPDELAMGRMNPMET